MNAATDKQPFDMSVFKKNLFVTLNTLLDYISDDDVNDWNTEFLPATIRCFVTSDYFMKQTSEEKERLVKQWQTVSYILQLMEGLFIDGTRENLMKISEHLRTLLSYD